MKELGKRHYFLSNQIFCSWLFPYWESEGLHLSCNNKKGDALSYTLSREEQGRGQELRLESANERSAKSREPPYP